MDAASSCRPPRFFAQPGATGKGVQAVPIFSCSTGAGRSWVGAAMAHGAGGGRGSALRPLCLASCLCRLPVHRCPQHPASSAGVNQWRPPGMCHGSRCVAAPIRQAFPAPLLCLRWFMGFSRAGVGFLQLLPGKPSFGAFPVVSQCLFLPGNGLQGEPRVTLMWLYTSVFTNSAGLLLQGTLSKHPICSAQMLSDPAGPVPLGRE